MAFLGFFGGALERHVEARRATLLTPCHIIDESSQEKRPL